MRFIALNLILVMFITNKGIYAQDTSSVKMDTLSSKIDSSCVDSSPSISGTSKGIFVKRKVDNRAFHLGEKLYFSVNWGPINAGNAIMALPETTTVNGERCYRAISVIKTNKFFSLFFKVEDVVESLIDVEGIFPWRFKKRLREGKYRAEVYAEYDQRNHLAITKGDTIKIPEYVQDALSIFYYIRTVNLKVGESIYVDNISDGKVYPLEVKVLRKERIRVGAGTFDCILIEPKLKGAGIFRQKGKLTIWLTDDERKIPVLMKSKIAIGSINLELEKMEGVNKS